MSLESFFNPKSVAIVGASRQKGKVGYEILTNMIRAGYEGKIFPVNPKSEMIEGLQRLSQLATEFPQIQEMDINPYVVGPEGMAPIAVDARMSVEQVE
jgi:acyl-CoA synthetase (NDP forming)